MYIVDQPARGRSGWQSKVDGATSTFTTQTIESRFTATTQHDLWPQATLHTQWPGSGSKGDPIFDAFYRSMVPGLTSAVETSELMKAAGSELLDKIGVRDVIDQLSQLILLNLLSPPLWSPTRNRGTLDGFWATLVRTWSKRSSLLNPMVHRFKMGSL